MAHSARMHTHTYTAGSDNVIKDLFRSRGKFCVISRLLAHE